MALNLEKMRKAREEKQRGQDFWQVPEGETAVYICPPCRPEDEINFYEVRLHYGMKDGGQNDKAMAVCLDANKNTILQHPALIEHLEAMGKDISGGCPKCEEIDSGVIKDEDKLKRIRSQSRYLWNLVPMKYRASTSAPWAPVTPPNIVQPLLCGWSVWDGIMEQIGSEGDVTDFDTAILVRIQREGKGQNNTKYKIQSDSETLRKPLKLSPELRAAITAALVPGGTGDMYRLVASMLKSRDAMVGLMTGVKPETEESAEVPEEAPTAPAPAKGKLSVVPGGKTAAKPAVVAKAPAKAPAKKDTNHGFPPEVIEARGPIPPCYTLDCAQDDAECQACPYKVECANSMGVDVPPDPETGAEGEVVTEDGAVAEALAAADAAVGHWYLLPDGTVGQAQGVSKHVAWFQLEDGSRIKLAMDDAVTLHEEVPSEAEEAPAEEAVEEPAAEEEAAPEPEVEEPPAPPAPVAKKPAATPAKAPTVTAKPAVKPAVKPAAASGNGEDKLAKLDAALKAKTAKVTPAAVKPAVQVKAPVKVPPRVKA